MILSVLPPRALGSLQGIKLHHLLGPSLDVGGEIAKAILPLGFWIRAGLAVNALRQGHRLAATLAGFHDGITGAAVKTTTVLAHEKTFCALFDRLTKHGPSLLCFSVSNYHFLVFIQKKAGA